MDEAQGREARGGNRDNMAALKEDLSALKKDLGKGARDAMEVGAQQLEAARETLMTSTDKFAQMSRDCIQKHPLKSVFVAAGIGAMAGAVVLMMVRRR